MLEKIPKKTSVQLCDVWWVAAGSRRDSGEITENEFGTCDLKIVLKLAQKINSIDTYI